MNTRLSGLREGENSRRVLTGPKLFILIILTLRSNCNSPLTVRTLRIGVEKMQLSNNSGNSKERRSSLDRLSEPRLPVQARLGETVSEDLAPRRIHPSLRIGARVSSPSNASPSNGKRKALGAESTSKATGKRKITKQARRVPRSPLGFNLRKVNAVRARNPPRKKLCLEKDKVGLSGGLSLFWRDSVTLDVLKPSSNIIDVEIKFKGSASFVSFIYGAPVTGNKAEFWNSVSQIGRGGDVL
ncbi:hypothetical protein F2Q70_00027750 [Brassica cretica]|uniref:Uncharacterized protein n=1 Tax=Brassica cretica TaxID=69181 RepID=A0A8S9L981_BRACR|nr:hypothetical protein F2Q70_00027750 [Brassica cretica]